MDPQAPEPQGPAIPNSLSRRAALGRTLLAAAGGLAACGSLPRQGRTGTGTRSDTPLDPGTVRVRLGRWEAGRPLEVVANGRPLEITRAAGGLRVDGRTATEHTIPSPAGVRVNGRLHRGVLHLTASPVGASIHLELDLEDYVEGVVAAELSLWSAEPAELEAQAIAARSYATAILARRRAARGARASLESGTQDQVYRGTFEPGASAGEQLAAARLRAAVRATRGRVLWQQDRPLAALFSASCGGHTSDLSAVFSGAADGAAGRGGAVCPACAARAAREEAQGAPDTERPLGWKVTLSPADLRATGLALGLDGPLRRLVPDADAGGRWITVAVEGEAGGPRRVTADELRAAVGRSRMKSARVLQAWPHAGERITGGLLLRGLGHGHGVGLCQEGAHDLAGAPWGWTSERILGTYFPGAGLRRI
ncbi:MAG: SpoIID/LytB domain-containing protein [Planctomycetes bacterium]|nr:SpoIID/LytB domain-containing protein [Planctomycetota bacterium]